mgnify:CR=1 FL=1
MSRAISLTGLPKPEPEPAEVVKWRSCGWWDHRKPVQFEIRADASQCTFAFGEIIAAFAGLGEAARQSGVSMAQAAESFQMLNDALEQKGERG